MIIRLEGPDDASSIRRVNELAFEGPSEARIVDRVRSAGGPQLSLVAEDDGGIVGHILFSPAVIRSAGREVVGMSLAPMAVLPDRQRQGIGSLLVERGLQLLREPSCPFVVVVGHPAFYPRFGFVPASRYGLRCQWPAVPDEAFLVLVLDRESIRGVRGVVKYADEFDVGT
jgi:putative acetyltransferase